MEKKGKEYEAQICSPKFGFRPVDKYFIRGKERGYPWGIFYIDETSGVFSAFTDYGNWSYGWNHHGEDSLKKFLVKTMDKEYFIMKLAGEEREFNAEESKKSIIQHLLNSRLERSITKEVARKLYGEVKELFLEVGYTRNSSIFLTYAYYNSYLSELFPCGDMPIVNDYPSSLVNAQRDLFIPLKNLLKKEIEGDKDIVSRSGRVGVSHQHW